jgi:DNA-binding helix-turn-helix protein
MVKNNIEIDTKVKLVEAGMTQVDLGEAIGTTGQYVNRLLKKNDVVNRMFVRMMEELGYDIVLTYVPKEQSQGK